MIPQNKTIHSNKRKIYVIIITLILLISLSSQVFALTYFYNPITIDDNGVVGYHNSMVIVNGNPAVSYNSANSVDLFYIRANDADGTSWGTPIKIGDAILNSDTSMAIIDGRPAIAYNEYDWGDNFVKFIRADDENGTSWTTPPVNINTQITETNYISLVVVNGNPAVSFYDRNSYDLIYVRATSTDGSTWGTPITVQSDGSVGSYNTLLVVNGNPAISYYDGTNDELKFIRANDANGTNWPTSAHIVDSNGDVGKYASMAVVNGNPAISYKDETNDQLKYIRANDASGSDWPLAARTLDSTGPFNQDTSLAVINGIPSISYYDNISQTLNFIQATNADGTAWGSPKALDSGRYMGIYPSLTTVNGHAGISYHDYNNTNLKFVLVKSVDISVVDGTTPISNGTTLNLGTTTLNNPITKTLTIINKGTSTLDITNLTLPPVDYSMVGNFTDEIPSGGSVDINIRLDAIQTTSAVRALQIRSNDTGLSPFTIRFLGNVTEAHGEIALLDGATEITDGTTDIFDFGSTTVGTPVSHTFTIENSSTEDLNLYSLGLPTGFSLQGTYDNTVPSGDSTDITVRLDAISVGSYSGDFSLANDDVDENPFNFTISGEVLDTSGEIAVLDGLIGIADGETTPVDFGDTVIGSPVSRTFTIQNLGVNDLDVYSLTLPYGFSLQGTYNHVVTPIGSTAITVQLDSQFVGTYSGEFSLSSDDTDENPFNFAISGNVLSADGEISVFDGATEITDGAGSVDYGSTPQGTPLSHTFTIRNSSTEILDLYALTLPTGFSLQGTYDHTVASGASTTITVQLDAQIVGSYSGEFSLANDDADEDPFNFTISGEVINTALATGIIAPLNGSTVLESSMQVAFNHDVLHDGSDEAADNPINYLLVEDGRNRLFDTSTCLLGVAGDDVQQTITSVTYDDSTYIATINTDPLPAGRYQLLACGTASIQDATGNVLNGGAFDSATTFTVVSANTGSGDPSTALLPATGFTPNKQTALPSQPAELTYNDMDSLSLQIPSLKVDVPIVGVPQNNTGWDVTWLTNAQAGWLNGTAYPTWDGNTVLTGHVTNASGNPGPFANIKSLKYGDKITIQAYGETYTYEVRENKLVTRDNMNVIEEHMDRDWVTLITCEYYNETTDEYLFRRVVRAVLVEVK